VVGDFVVSGDINATGHGEKLLGELRTLDRFGGGFENGFVIAELAD
jgi:hypothetical protein